MHSSQSGILADVPQHARYLTLSLLPDSHVEEALSVLKTLIDDDKIVIGLGSPLLKRLGNSIHGMRDFMPHSGPGFSVPTTFSALWLWLRGNDRGELLHLSRKIEKKLSAYFQLDSTIEAFQYKDSRDLTGYEDGTENPTGDDAINAGIVQNQGQGLDGSSFVAVQQWVHDLDHFDSMTTAEQDNTIGRRIADNKEIDDAPDSAHVKRTAQEDFNPEAFILRRSMPWSDTDNAGLVFVAFGHNFDAFEALLNRMVGNDDNIPDALFKFTQPITGSYFWCPPIKDNQLDLSTLGL